MVQDGAKERPKLQPDDSTGPVVRRIFDMAENRIGMLDIACAINDKEIPSAAGKPWSNNAVNFILWNEVYTGTLVSGAKAKDDADPVRVEGAFPAIVSKDQFRRVNSRMRSRASKATHLRRTSTSYLLSGLVLHGSTAGLLSTPPPPPQALRLRRVDISAKGSTLAFSLTLAAPIQRPQREHEGRLLNRMSVA